MKLIKTILTTAAVMVFAGQVATAQPVVVREEVVHVWDDPRTWWGNHFTLVTVPDFYQPGELSFDLFGTYWAGQRKLSKIFDTNIRNGVWGGGVGINYFITRELGIAIDMNMPDNRGHLIDTVQGSLIGRFPIGVSGVAPYVFGGGGRSTDQVWQWLGHGGVGIETRINPITGLFVDARYIWAEKSSDTLLFRGGVRLVF
jgi:hypothetical protein